jgi:hypothetical protein
LEIVAALEKVDDEILKTNDRREAEPKMIVPASLEGCRAFVMTTAHSQFQVIVAECSANISRE